MNRNDIYKITDAAIVYTLCLLQTGIVCSLFMKTIGLWAPLICAAADICIIAAAVRIGRIKPSAVFRFEKPSFKTGSTAALIYAAAILTAVPIFLLGHLIVPNFAAAAFRLTDYAAADKWWLVLLTVITAAVACAFLFEGYVYTRLRGIKNIFLRILAVSVAAGIFRLDMYIILPYVAVEFAILVIRQMSDSLVLPISLQIISAGLAISVSEIAVESSSIFGENMGVQQICGLSLVSLGAALTSVIGALAVDGKMKKMSPIVKTVLFTAAVAACALGCGIASL